MLKRFEQVPIGHAACNEGRGVSDTSAAVAGAVESESDDISISNHEVGGVAPLPLVLEKPGIFGAVGLVEEVAAAILRTVPRIPDLGQDPVDIHHSGNGPFVSANAARIAFSSERSTSGGA